MQVLFPAYLPSSFSSLFYKVFRFHLQNISLATYFCWPTPGYHHLLLGLFLWTSIFYCGKVYITFTISAAWVTQFVGIRYGNLTVLPSLFLEHVCLLKLKLWTHFSPVKYHSTFCLYKSNYCRCYTLENMSSKGSSVQRRSIWKVIISAECAVWRMTWWRVGLW